jgi:hypothetical protein
LKVHRVFGPGRLDIEIKDCFGQPAIPPSGFSYRYSWSTKLSIESRTERLPLAQLLDDVLDLLDLVLCSRAN